MSAEQAHIAIEVRLDGEQISGQASDGLREPESFSGWVGLIGALDRLLDRPRGADRPADDSTWCAKETE